MLRVSNPYPLFLDLRGALLDSGYIYIGEAGADPEVSPLTVYFDEAKTIVATQPLRTRGGYVVNGSTPVAIWVDEEDYSQRVEDADGNQVFFAPSAAASGAGASYQPLDSDLTAIAALTTTAFGRALLETANAAGLKAAAGIVDALPLTGGTVSNNINRSGAGPHIYHNDSAFTSGRLFPTDVGAADPTSQPGDIWLKLT